MTNKKIYKYCVVEFIDNNQANTRKRLIDLVPQSWLLQASKNKWKCKYPPKTDYKYIPDWVKEQKPPETEWKLYKISLISYAIDHDQGKRRLQRAFDSQEIELSENNSDMENVSLSQPMILNQNNVRDELRKTLSMSLTTLHNDSFVESLKKDKSKSPQSATKSSTSEFSDEDSKENSEDNCNNSVSSWAGGNEKRTNKEKPSLDV